MKFTQIQKAITAGVTAGVAAFGQGIADGSMTKEEWAITIGAVLFAGYATFKVPNKTESDTKSWAPGPRPYGSLREPPPPAE
jgi:hypothetical protein